MADLKVSYADLTGVARQIEQGHLDVLRTLGQLKHSVEALVDTGFVTDRASEAFEAAYAEVNQSLTAAADGLAEMTVFLDQAAAAYHQADSDLAMTFGR